jgi:hypothetical protein
MGNECSKHGEMKNIYRIFVGKPEVKTAFVRFDYNIKTDLREIGLAGVDWIHLT